MLSHGLRFLAISGHDCGEKCYAAAARYSSCKFVANELIVLKYYHFISLYHFSDSEHYSCFTVKLK